MSKVPVYFVGLMFAFGAAAHAGPIYTCPGASTECNGQTFALWIDGSGSNSGGQYFDIAVSINTTGYTGTESHLAHGVEFKNVTDLNAVYSNLALQSAPGGTSNWIVSTGQLNPGQECALGDPKKDTGCAVWLTAPGGYDFFIGETLTWIFRFNAPSLGNGTGHLKYYYSAGFVPCVPKSNGKGCENGTGEWSKVAGLLSQDIPLQDCRNGLCDDPELPLPEPATLLLLGGGFAAFMARRRRRV